MRPRDFFALALASTVALSWACGSGDEKLPTVKPHTATDVPVVGDDAGIPNPTDVDCSDPKNCYHLICWDDPACSQVTTPGGCKVGEVKELGTGQCRACTKDDCDGLPSYCCGAAVCQGYLECTMFICREIAAACKGTTSETCGFHDLDGDDAWGDCDEAPSDPCCFCHVAVGCGDSECGGGEYVLPSGKCGQCTATTCSHPTCMGLHGCPTNCPKGEYFDGVRCRDCTGLASAVVPACP